MCSDEVHAKSFKDDDGGFVKVGEICMLETSQSTGADVLSDR